MKARRIAIMALSLVAGGIVSVSGCGDNDPAPEVGSTAIASEESAAKNQSDRQAAIYAAVIRRLVTKDHTFGGGDPGFKVIYVLDGRVSGAGDPQETLRDPEEPFPHDVKDGIRFLSKLADLPPIEFVSERNAVVTGTHGGSQPGRVKKEGVLITLGPTKPGGDKVHVGATLWINGLAGLWTTYVVRDTENSWRIVGTTGPMAIS